MNHPLPTRHPFRWTGLLLVFIFMLTTACNLPAYAPSPSPAVPIMPTSTAAIPTPSKPAQTAAPSATVSPTAVPTQTLSPTPKSAYRGLIAYDRASQSVIGTDFTGAPLNIKLKLTGADWLGFNQAQWANDSIYYLNPTDKTINQISTSGAAQKLAFIPARDGLSFTISADGKKIAWSFNTNAGKNPASELWVANTDGSNAKQIAHIDATSNTKWLVLSPYRWLADGRLLYIDEPTGIGGYILFYGFAGLHLFDPANNKLTNLTPSLGAGSLCLQEVSPDMKTVVSTCATSQNNDISFVNLGNNQALSITHQADQNQVGSPAWSPAGGWMAYAFARADPNDEQGSVALVANGSSTPKILAALPNGYFTVETWITENQFIVQRYEGDVSSIWLFNRDGTPPLKLSNGLYISLINN